MKLLGPYSKIGIAIVLLHAISGCASIGLGYVGETTYNAAFREKIIDVTKLSDEDLSKLKEVKLVDSLAGIEGVSKGQIVGLSCKLTSAIFVFKWIWKPELNEKNGVTPEDAARTQLRIKAMLNGANTVVAPSCKHKDGIDWGNNCFESWRCTGQAYAIP